jgi:hypothetical protein
MMEIVWILLENSIEIINSGQLPWATVDYTSLRLLNMNAREEFQDIVGKVLNLFLEF